MDVLSLKIYSRNITEQVIIFNCSASQDWYEGARGQCPFVSQYKQKSVLQYLNIRIEVHFCHWWLWNKMQRTCHKSYRSASRFTRFTRYALHYNLEIWEGSGKANIMPKTDFHCPLLVCSFKIMQWVLGCIFIFHSMLVGWYFGNIASWKQEITSLWNHSGEIRNRTPDLLLRKPRA